jgi:rhodanese-related sulfurtransferase
MKNNTPVVSALVFMMTLLISCTLQGTASDVRRITKEEVKDMLADPGVIILDVRAETDWKTDEFKIKGAVRENPQEVEAWASKYPKDRTLILYCA